MVTDLGVLMEVFADADVEHHPRRRLLAQLTEDKGDVLIKRVGCLGLCAAGPLVEIAETGQMIGNVSADDVEPVLAALAAVKPGAERQEQAPFFEKQVRVATENFGKVDPESLDDYVAAGGFQALRRVLSEMTSAEVRDELLPKGTAPERAMGKPVVDASAPAPSAAS